MIKDIVVNLGLGAHDPACEYAVSIGEAFEAHVLGIAVSYEPVIPGTVSAVVSSGDSAGWPTANPPERSATPVR